MGERSHVSYYLSISNDPPSRRATSSKNKEHETVRSLSTNDFD